MSNVLVVLVNYNSPKDTYQCLESLALSTLKPKVVVVDNGSTGEGIISEAKAKLCYADTHVMFNPNNDGFGGGNNLGLEWALADPQYEYFFILNNDTVVLPETISQLLNHLDENPAQGMCSPSIFWLQEPDLYWFGGGYLAWKNAGAVSPNFNRRLNQEVDKFENTFISGCAMFVRREVLTKVGLFSPDFFMYCEDLDYCQRVLNAGYTIGYVPSIKIYHDAHASVMKDDDKGSFPHHWSNKNIVFPVLHMVYGSFVNLRKHTKGLERLIGTARLGVRYSKWGFTYLVHLRFDGLGAIVKGMYFSVLGRPPL